MLDRIIQTCDSRISEMRPGQRVTCAWALSSAGRLDESREILDGLLEVVRNGSWMLSIVALELAYVLARQGHRDQAFRAVGLTRWTTNLVVRAWVEATLGERKQAVRLLRESGIQIDKQHFGTGGRFESLLDYPPFQELVRPKG